MAGVTGVTVVCITYHQAQFLAQALEGIVKQKTTFPFQVLVGEDHGQDGSAEIILDFAKRYPGLIQPFIREENLGAQRNLIDLCQRAQTPYIALCEGDDYWTDEYKLQKQFDYMEAHPSCRACFHDARVSVETQDGLWFQEAYCSHDEDGSFYWPRSHNNFVQKSSYSLADFLVYGFAQTSTMFYRWNYDLVIPEWYYTHSVGDYTLWAMQVDEGEYAYLNESMSVYRVWDGGSYFYKTRFELWSGTREDWISIDLDLLDYFLAKGASSYIIEAGRKRLRMDLDKLLRARYVLQGVDGFRETAEQYADIIELCYGFKYSGLADCVVRLGLNKVGKRVQKLLASRR